MNEELKEGWFTVPPPAEEGEERELLEALKLQDGSPLYHMFFDPNAINISASEAHAAKTKLSFYINNYPEAVKQCEGITAEEARRILEAIDQEETKEAA